MNRGALDGDVVTDAVIGRARSMKKMTRFDQSITRFAAFSSLRTMRWLPVCAVLAAVAAPATAEARSRAAGTYDGSWNVVLATTRGTAVQAKASRSRYRAAAFHRLAEAGFR